MLKMLLSPLGKSSASLNMRSVTSGVALRPVRLPEKSHLRVGEAPGDL